LRRSSHGAVLAEAGDLVRRKRLHDERGPHRARGNGIDADPSFDELERDPIAALRRETPCRSPICAVEALPRTLAG
jgi:hypothetical protein